MREVNGLMQIKRIQLPLGGYREEYQLLLLTPDDLVYRAAEPREVSAIVVSSWDAPGYPDLLIIGPYRLRFLEKAPEAGGAVYIPDLLFSRLRVLLYRSTRWLDDAYRRVIVTAHVWGLASYHRGTIPTWRDLNVVIWLQKRRKHEN